MEEMKKRIKDLDARAATLEKSGHDAHSTFRAEAVRLKAVLKHLEILEEQQRSEREAKAKEEAARTAAAEAAAEAEAKANAEDVARKFNEEALAEARAHLAAK